MENDLIKAKEVLESKVKERTAELLKLNDRLKSENAIQKQIESALQKSNIRNLA